MASQGEVFLLTETEVEILRRYGCWLKKPSMAPGTALTRLLANIQRDLDRESVRARSVGVDDDEIEF